MQGNTRGGKQLGKDKKSLVINLPADIHTQVFEAASEKGLTASDWARLLIREALANRCVITAAKTGR